MKEADQIDAIDRRIIRELQRDATLSHAALAEKVGASPASVWRRVRSLDQAGVLAHPSVANAASTFALRQVKYTTEIPV